MRKVILMMILAAMSSIAMARWVEFGGNKYMTIYADPTSIRKVGDKVKMLDLVDYNISKGGSVMSIKGQDEFDCKQELIRSLYSSFYDENMGVGKEIGSTSEAINWQPVASNSGFETLWKIACGKR